MIEITAKITRIRFLTYLLFILGSISGLTSCVITDYLLGGLPTDETPTPPEEGDLALITFNVRVPGNTPADQPILLSVLDEVTGLALNAKRYPMEIGEDGEYTLDLSFPVGTIVKYRYSRRSLILAEEHITDGRAVRYRLYHVTGPGQVHDVISCWNDTSFEGMTGRITGSILDADSEKPIPGLLVTAGGAQAFTTGDGTFLIEGLPSGTHNLVVLATDGSYPPFQQGALVAEESNTPATIKLKKSEMVDITFLLHVPEGTPPAIPIRIAGNLWQLGNTFSDLSGGVSTLATRMPTLSSMQDRIYSMTLNLPAGTDLRYKYTLGDGFWNTERTQDGTWLVRQLILPDQSLTMEDTVETWSAGENAPITFDITVPINTPPEEDVFIQFNPYGWTEPLPMWNLGGERWAYILYSPLDMLSKLGYRYCRAGQCGQADDARTPGDFTSGQVVQAAKEPKGLPDVIENWNWWGFDRESQIDFSQVKVEEPYESTFLTGVEFQERFHPSWIPLLPTTIEDVAALNTNLLILTPGWTLTRSNPPVLEPIPGNNPMWMDNGEMILAGRNSNLHVAVRPIAQFPIPKQEWWRSAPRDFAWWVSWFDSFDEFILHYAVLAEAYGATHLILGGDWMSPAMPGGKLSDGSASGVPPDAEIRYSLLIAKIRERYSGKIGWALSFPEEVVNPPNFLDEVDLLYILWDEALAKEISPNIGEMKETAEKVITNKLQPLWQSLKEDGEAIDIILCLAYPSIDGAANECLADPHQECILPSSLNYPAPDYPLLELDLGIQARIYYAMLAAISQHSWINGVVSRGYYPPALLQDKSTSIHGKPAEEVLKVWYAEFLGHVE